MSSALAIAAVTAALKDLLNDGLLNHDLSAMGSFTVTSTAPDRITTGQNEPNQLNLFLYQVTPNQGWRNAGYPARDTRGTRLTNPPLALDLHYLLTAYGAQDLHAEILLGYAMQLLHETPMLTRDQLRTSLANPSPLDPPILPPAFQSLPSVDLADQVELIKISPVFLSTEELSKMWTAMQARYRTTMAYMVSVVLIQSTDPIRSAPPVLQRGKDDSGPTALAAPFATLVSARPAISDLLPAMRLGDDVLVTGAQLSGPQTLALDFRNAQADVETTVSPVTVLSDTQLTAHVPSIAEDANAMDEWAVGVYSLSLEVTKPSISFTTNGVPIALSPLITVTPLTPAPGDIDVTVTCTPRIRKEQEARTVLLFGEQSVAPQSIDTPVDVTKPTTLLFQVPGVAAGSYVVRLRVDGIDSLPVIGTGTPPKFTFDPQQTVQVA